MTVKGLFSSCSGCFICCYTTQSCQFLIITSAICASFIDMAFVNSEDELLTRQSHYKVL